MAKANVPAKGVERDEVAESLQGVVEFLERNYIKLIVLTIAIAAAVLLKISYDNSQQRAQRQLNNKINQVLAEMIAIERTIDPQQRDQRIETLATQIDQMIEETPGTPLLNQAHFLKGRLYFIGDRLTDAQEAYQHYLATATSPEDLARGEIALGYAYENEAFLKTEPSEQRDALIRALGRFESAASRVPKSYLYYYALMGQARAHELMGDDQRAIELYREVVEDRPPPRAAPSEADAEDQKNQSSNELVRIVMIQMEAFESQMSFQATARLRLERLKAKVGTLEGEAQPRAVTSQAGAE